MIKSKQRSPRTRKLWSCKCDLWQEATKEPVQMVQMCPNPCPAGDLVTRSTSPSQQGAQSREIFKSEKRRTVKCSWPSTAPPCWLRAKGVLLCCHSLALTQAGFSSELRHAQPAPVSLLDYGDVLKVSVMPCCLSTFQGCSWLIVSVYESSADISTSCLGSLRTLTVNPAEMVRSATSTVDNTTGGTVTGGEPPRNRWKRNYPLEWGQNSTSSNVKGKAEENSKQTECRSWQSNRLSLPHLCLVVNILLALLSLLSSCNGIYFSKGLSCC